VVHVRDVSAAAELANSKAKIVAVDAARRPGAALACDYRTERDVIGLNRSIWRGQRY